MFRNILIILLILFNATVFAENVKKIDFSKFVSLVLQKDLNIKSYKLNREISKIYINKYKGFFDPVLSSKISKDFTKEYIGSRLQSISKDFVINKNVNFDFSLSKKFALGTDISLSFQNNRFKTNSDWSVLNPEYSSLLMLNIDQPILRGAGIVINKNEILKAEHLYKKSEYDVKNFINNEIVEAGKWYFELVYAYKYYKVQEEYLKLAQNTNNINLKKFKLGLIPENVLNETKAEVAAREESVLKAFQNIKDIEDVIKKYFNDLDKDYKIIPVTNFFKGSFNGSLKQAISQALKNRYEIKKLNEDIKVAELDIVKNKNNLLPQLNFNIYGALSGKGSGYSEDIERLRSNEYHKWGVGLTFSIPINNRTAKANYKISKINREQLEIEKKELINSIILEVKKSYRNLLTLKKRIEANEKALETAYEKMTIEEKKYQNNLSTVFRVFSYQTDYIQEKVKLLRTRVDYSKELLNFYKITGKNLFKIN